MKKYTMFMDQRNQHSETEYTTQSNLQIQCNPCQAINSIFHRTRTTRFIICNEIRKTSKSQSNLEKRMELEESTCLTLDYITKLQSSKQYGNWHEDRNIDQ